MSNIDFNYKPIQLLRNDNIYNSKAEAVEGWIRFINDNPDRFRAGEEITARYYYQDTIQSIIAIIDKDSNGIFTLSTGFDLGDTKPIIESDTEPTDKNVVWITDNGDSSKVDKLEADIKALNATVKALCDVIARYEEIRENGINLGSVNDNGTKLWLENSAEPQAPDILSGTTDNTSEEKPDYDYKYPIPNIASITCKTCDTETILKEKYINGYLIPNEFIYCLDNNGLYAINGKTNRLVKLNGNNSEEPEVQDIMSGITQNTEKTAIAAIKFVAPSGNFYDVTIDDNGALVSKLSAESKYVVPSDYVADTNGETNKLLLQKLYINSVYCGGNNSNEHSLNLCSHNFVELSNLTTSDINLNGLVLKYAETGQVWHELKLTGFIKQGSTFLIRGAQCSVREYSKIKVDTYDMEWYENGELIKFSSDKAKFYLAYDVSNTTYVNPYHLYEDNTLKVQYGYIDLVGLQNTTSIDGPGGYESAVYKQLNANSLMMKYYAMDPVSQATKALDARKNSTDWTYIDLNKNNGDIIPNIEVYTPMSAKENKTIFYNKTKLNAFKPSMISCSFGIQATDNEDGSGATRCFNWISKGYRSEYLWIRKEGESWIRYASISGEPQIKNSSLNPRYFYNKITQEYSDGTVFTANKQVISGLTVGVYEYTAGVSDSNGQPIAEECTDIKTFKVRTSTDVNTNGFQFVQTSDQQGFNWGEYQVWKYASRQIANDNPNIQFMVNTGDMTQNGNRMGEWLDYFNAKNGYIDNLEEMSTIGNNDQSPAILYMLGDGSDISKLSPNNILFFYTFELNPNNLPYFTIQFEWNNKTDTNISGKTNVDCYVPSLYSFNYGNVHFMCVNSEITTGTEYDVFFKKNDTEAIGDDELKTNGYLYEAIKTWCEKDLSGNTSNWNVAFCHEIPFTILTWKNVYQIKNGSLTSRGGSHLNTVVKTGNSYWFSEFCQNNNIRLVIGGHKHTQSMTYPLLENVKYITDEGGVTTRIVDSTKPIIQVTDGTGGTLNTYFGCTDLIEKNGLKYPSSWFNIDGTDFIDDGKARSASVCCFEFAESGITAPVYAMSQTTGYKHTSNKELPTSGLPWEACYYPATEVLNANGNDVTATVNSNQRYPFYTIWNFTNDSIVGNIRYVDGIFDSGGKYDLNKNEINAKNGNSNSHIGSLIVSKNAWDVTITKESYSKTDYR